MYCKYLNAECNLNECQLNLIGGKRMDKEQYKCYMEKYIKSNRLNEIMLEIAILHNSRLPTWIMNNRFNQLKTEKAKLIKDLGL